MRVSLFLLSILACAPAFPERELVDDPAADYDRDGVTENAGDCDDTDPRTQGRSWFEDADGDGHGGALASQGACTAPSGAIAVGGDCDDTRADVHPGAVEQCDGVDSDCDGAPDTQLVTLEDGRSYGSIAEALAEAGGGGTLRVCAGTYTAPLELGPGVTLVGVAGAEVTRLDVSPDARGAEGADVVVRGTPGGEGTRLVGLTLTGLAVRDAEVELEDCVVAGAGVEVERRAGVDQIGGSVTIRGSVVRDHLVTGVRVEGGTLTLVNTRIHGNYGVLAAGGLAAEDATVVADGATRIYENATSGSGGGIHLLRARFEGSVTRVEANDAYVHGGGARLEDSTLVGVEFYGNRALNRGGAMYTRGSVSVEGVFAQSSSAGRGGALYVASGTTSLVDSVLLENLATFDGGNVYVESGSLVWDAAGVYAEGGLQLGMGEANRFGADLAYLPGATIDLVSVGWGLRDFYDLPSTNYCVVDAAGDVPARGADGEPLCDLLLEVRDVHCGAAGCEVLR